MLLIAVARKPLDGTVAKNVLKWGTGAMNLDAVRVGTETRTNPDTPNNFLGVAYNSSVKGSLGSIGARDVVGRWPANLILSEQTAKELDEQSGECPSTLAGRAVPNGVYSNPGKSDQSNSMFGLGGGRGQVYADTGGASRFFKVVKEQSHV